MSNENPLPPQDPLNFDLVKQFLENQAIGLQVQQQDQEIKKREIENSHEYATKLLDAQLIDRERERDHSKSSTNSAGCLIAFLSLLIAGGLCYALYLNKDQIVTELVKALIFLISGGISGYGIKAIKSKSSDDKSKD